MDFAYSPHREGGAMHLPSPTHHHGYTLDHLSSIQQLRRSLSRSPSKPSRFHLRKSETPASPLSPLALARALSPKSHTNPKDNAHSYPDSPLAAQVPPSSVKKRFTLRRTAPFRQSPRTRAASKSPRRVLADSTDQGNATPFVTRRSSGEENDAQFAATDLVDHPMTGQKPACHRDIDDRPVKFRFSHARQDLASAAAPAKSSPLKRSDGIMNLDTAGRGSPVAKRRSLHGTSSLGADFDIFAQSLAPRKSDDEPRAPSDTGSTNTFSFSSPVPQMETPLRKSLSLRKSTLSQRQTSTPRARPAFDGEFALPGAAASKTRNRMSLDSSLAFSGTTQSPFRKSTNFDLMRGPAPPPLQRGASVQQPHPLSNALTPSSSSAANSPAAPPTPAPAPPTAAPPRDHRFARSLPLGISRPQYASENADSSFATPMVMKISRPEPNAFLSTGLQSKKYLNVMEIADLPNNMPGTPSKRASFPPVTASPSVNRRSGVFDLGKISRPEFGQPSTPFSVHRPTSSASFGQGVNIFGSFTSSHQRRSSFASIDGDDSSHSPCGNRMTDSQSSNDDMPPTPTKQNEGAGRRSKDSSLRRKTFRQGRPSLGASTFSAPGQDEPTIDIPDPSTTRKLFGATSPHTPNETFTPPDASKLSISAGQRRGSLPFNSSTNSSLFPPATPTTPRDSGFFASLPGGVIPMVGLTENDVDSSIAERFKSISKCGQGEFSTVYRVSNPVRVPSFESSPAIASRVSAIKVTRKPYAGVNDRQSKLREVRVLQALQGHDHVISYEDHWEFQNHLYIQTEFCEEGNLMNFLTNAGHKSRLDDFRIWKILLELSSGVKHIHDSGYLHLDLKPANILITFDGCLKIGDFGLATPDPAPSGIEGDGDRRYLAPEALQRGVYHKPGDVYSLGAMMLEIAGNIILPHNGTSWQRLRTGDFSELPSLTWSSESSLNRDANGEPLDDSDDWSTSAETFCIGGSGDSFAKQIVIPITTGGLTKPPSFMVDYTDPDSLHVLTQWMMQPDPAARPTIDQVYRSFGCRWTESRLRSGATIYEGVWGPADDVIAHHVHEDDMMDMS